MFVVKYHNRAALFLCINKNIHAKCRLYDEKIHVPYTKCSIIHAEGLDNPCIFCVQIVKIASSNNGERQNKGGRNMKRKMLSVLLCAAMMGTTLAGATSVLAADDKDSDSKWEYKEATLTFLIDPDTASSGYQAVFDLCEKETGIHIETELRASGGDGDNQVKTRLASGEMTDLCGYNSGAKLNELDPESNFIDISGEEWASRLDDTFASAVSAGSDSAVYGIPLTATNLGCILYNKDLYEKYDLEVPDTWEDFLKNCDTLKDAGETAVIGSLGDS